MELLKLQCFFCGSVYFRYADLPEVHSWPQPLLQHFSANEQLVSVEHGSVQVSA